MSCAELVKHELKYGPWWIHDMMPFDENPKVEG